MMIKAILKKYWKILLSMTLVSALGVGILTGLTGSFVSLVKNMDRYIEEYQYPDAVITTEVVPKKRAEDLLKTEGVEYVDARLAADTVIENAEGRMLSIRAFSYTPEDRQIMHVWSGTVPDGSDDSLLAEVLFARRNHIQVGDTITIRVGEEFRPFRVSGHVSLPEDLSVQENKYSSGLNPDFGYLYVPLSVLNRETAQKKTEENEALAEKEKELKEAEEEAKSIYLDALEQLAEGRSELLEKISEFRRVSSEMQEKLKELEDAEKELLDTQADVLAKKAELEAKVQEALNKQKELLELKDMALSLLDEIQEALKEADKKEAELLALKEEALKKKTELLEKREELEEMIRKLQEAKEALKKIDEALLEAREGYETLTGKTVTRAVSLLRLLNQKIRVSWLSDTAETILDFVELCKKYGIIIDIDQPICTAAAKILETIDRIEADYKILTAENARDLVKKAAAGDESVIHSEEYQRIKTAAERYVIFKEPLEEALDAAIEAAEELLSPVRKEGLREHLEEIRDLFGTTVHGFSDLLGSDAEIIRNSGAEKLLHGENPREAADALNYILQEWKACGNAFDSEMPITEGTVRLLELYKQIEADYTLFTAEAELIPEEVLNRYLQDSDVISERKYEIARARCSWLYELIQKYHLREIMEKIREYTSMTWREVLEETKKLKDYAKQLEELTGREIKTVGEFVLAYDEALAKLKVLIEQLEKERDEIIEQLREAGVEEDKIDETIEQLEQGIREINDGLVQIEDGLKQIEEGLSLIDAKRKEADEAIRAIKDGLDEIEDGLRQIEDGLREAEPLREQIRAGLEEIEDGLRRIRGGREEIETGLSEGQQKITEASNTLAGKESEIEEEWAKQLKEFENLEEELDKAYQELDDSEGYEDLCNQFLIYFKEGADPAAVLKRCEEALGNTEIKDSYDYENSDVSTRINNNTGPIGKLARFMPVVFYIVIITVIFLFMSILVRLCRREIGILMALGISRGSIRRLFGGVGLLVSVGSYIPGLGIGWILITLISEYYYNFFPLPFRVSEFDMSMLVPALVVTVLAVQAATLIGTGLISSIQPSEAMARFTEKPPVIPKFLDILLRPFRELEKYSILSMFRNPLRFVLTVICISATSILIFSSMSFIASKEVIVSQLFDQRIFYDCEVFTSEGKENAIAETLNALDYVEHAEASRTYFKEVSFQENVKQVMISSIPKKSDMTGVIDSSGNRIMPEEAGIVMDRYTAKEIGAGAGDLVIIDNIPVRITELSDQYISRIQYVSEAQADLFGKESIGTVLVRLPKEKEEELRHYLSEQDGYLYTIFTGSLKAGIENLYETYDLYAWILVGFSVVIGFLIVFNITETTLLEQKKELCVLRTLGFSVTEIGRNLFSQSVLRFLGSLMIGLPIGAKIAEYGLSLLKSMDRDFPYASGIKEYAVTAGIVLLYILISHYVSILRMNSWDIVESVKDKE